ncbi:hypothetical protein [Paraconexibacter algicola]|uniref:Uncharacterized protein n=1 Tax=Paraconexibacter algicola TaxID=2133960 RepID=A0A2T4UII5_9ACTN|nr:hypothetical protein [Paraconexibacter algicola]PTL59054.1 hypothetical protein C7Y72_05035 [Paraconexibacter algicola]
MITRRIVVASTAAVALAAGGAAAVAATVKDDRKEAESQVLSDAAKRLNVTPSELKDALGKAQDAQLDQAVKDGKLTQAQADAIKKRRAEEGTVLGLPGRGPHGGPGRGFGPGGPGGPGHGPGRGLGPLGGAADAVAKELGLTREKLLEQLRSGTTLAAIAKAQNKDLADVKKAARTALAKTLADQVADKKITDAQRDHVLEEFDEHFDEFASGQGGPGRFFGRGRGHHGPGGPGGPGGPAPTPPTGPSGPATPDPQATPGSYPGEIAPGANPA